MRRMGLRLAGALTRAFSGARVVLTKVPGRRHGLRAFTLVALLVSFLGAPSIIYHLYVQSVEMQFYQLHMSYVDINSSGCAIPHYEPVDERTKSFIFPWPPVACGRPQPYLTYVDQEGFIRVNWTGAREAGLAPNDFECIYSEILRKKGSDDEVEYGVEHVLHDTEKLYYPYVRVRCVLRSTGQLLYETSHAFVTDLYPELAASVLESDSTRPSIFMLGIDSMSRLNMMRQLPKVYTLLTDVYNSTVFSGLTKVGDNTYPNMLTMLTGIAARKNPDIKVSVWGDDKANDFFDDLPVVWKNFSRQGYLTMYSEDLPEYTAFNYLAKGFVHKPTDYYMRPFWIAMESIRHFKSTDSRCYGNFPQYEFLFNYSREFVRKMASKRYYAFTFITNYSHNHINSVQVLDEPVRAMLADMLESGDLRNTIVIVMGDHGNRFDAIRTTVVGRVEERMPFFAVALPPSLRAARPHLEKNMQANRHTLISWYDVYEMLADVAFDNLAVKPRVQRWGELGTSLFRHVPSRTCTQAGVPYEYCVCARERPFSAKDPLVKAMAIDLVRHVNALVEARADPPGVCAHLTLSDVLNAQLILPNAQLARPRGFAATFRVALRVSPSQALLEGHLEIDAWSREGRVIGDVARINKYGNQSHCVRDRILRLYCYCIDLLGSSPPG